MRSGEGRENHMCNLTIMRPLYVHDDRVPFGGGGEDLHKITLNATSTTTRTQQQPRWTGPTATTTKNAAWAYDNLMPANHTE